MEYFATILVIAVLFIICYYAVKNNSRDVTLVKSNLDNQKYFVRNLPDKYEAADRLAFIRSKLTQVVKLIGQESPEALYEKYVKGDKMETQMSVTEFTSCIKQLLKKYRNSPDVFSESTPDAKYTSYSVNKGEQLIFCLRLKKEGDRLF